MVNYLTDKNKQLALAKYMSLNKDYFNRFGFGEKLPKFYSLTYKGRKYFNSPHATKSTNIYTIQNFALMNAFLYQSDILYKYDKPIHPYHVINGITYYFHTTTYGNTLFNEVKSDQIVVCTKRTINLYKDSKIIVPDSFTYLPI